MPKEREGKKNRTCHRGGWGAEKSWGHWWRELDTGERTGAGPHNA